MPGWNYIRLLFKFRIKIYLVLEDLEKLNALCQLTMINNILSGDLIM